MQKNDKFYTFLFSRAYKNQIKIRRVQISRKLTGNSLLGLAFLLGISVFGIGIVGVLNNPTLAKEKFESGIEQIQNRLSADLPDTVDYSRPASASNFSINSGGPDAANSMKLTEAEVENRLAIIQSTANPGSIPSIWAHLGKINNEFGFRRSPFGGRHYEFHAGMDIDGERGDLVVAPASGTVTKAGWQGGYGNMIEIDHGNGLTTRYGHLSKIEVQIGDPITRGQLIAFVGSTGRSTGPHLHYELRLGDRPVNPRRFLPPEPMLIKKVAS